MKSLIIFLIWLAVAVIGAIAKAGKKSQDQGHTPTPGGKQMEPGGTDMSTEQTREQQLREMLDRHRRMARGQSDGRIADTAPVSEPQPQPGPEPIAAKEKPLPEEGIAATETHEETTRTAPTHKNRDMDFDPVEMVVYSEVMEPGYEKY